MALLRPTTLPRLTHRHFGFRVWMGCFAFCGLLLLAGRPAPAQEIQAPEQKVKAAFLFNFTKLVDWPTNSFVNSNAPLVIGVLGKDPFGQELDLIAARRVVNGRKLQIARFNSVEAITNCQVLFIGESERRKLDTIFATLREKPILTVGDMKGFEARGMITMVKADDTIEFRINLAAASRAGLEISSRLTRLDKTLRPISGDATNSPPANRE